MIFEQKFSNFQLGGILLPNDGRCHLSNSRYIGSTIYVSEVF